MASNETRARLMGRQIIDFFGYECAPLYDTSRGACAELLEYVKKEGRVAHFINALSQQFYGRDHADDLNPFGVMHFMTATPVQLTAAFDATFAKELAELENKHGK